MDEYQRQDQLHYSQKGILAISEAIQWMEAAIEEGATQFDDVLYALRDAEKDAERLRAEISLDIVADAQRAQDREITTYHQHVAQRNGQPAARYTA